MRAATVVLQLCKSCMAGFKFYCMFYCTCEYVIAPLLSDGNCFETYVQRYCVAVLQTSWSARGTSSAWSRSNWIPPSPNSLASKVHYTACRPVAASLCSSCADVNVDQPACLSVLHTSLIYSSTSYHVRCRLLDMVLSLIHSASTASATVILLSSVQAFVHHHTCCGTERLVLRP